MTPRGKLDERCFTEWLKGCVFLGALTCVLGMVWLMSSILLWWMLSW